MKWKKTPPDPSLPWVWCDFNAGTEEGEYWVLDIKDLGKIKPRPAEGIRIFIYDYENEEETEIVGCEAILKKKKGIWIAIPDEDTWYSSITPNPD